MVTDVWTSKLFVSINITSFVLFHSWNRSQTFSKVLNDIQVPLPYTQINLNKIWTYTSIYVQNFKSFNKISLPYPYTHITYFHSNCSILPTGSYTPLFVLGCLIAGNSETISDSSVGIGSAYSCPWTGCRYSHSSSSTGSQFLF